VAAALVSRRKASPQVEFGHEYEGYAMSDLNVCCHLKRSQQAVLLSGFAAIMIHEVL
jgi:hypothetical protein